MRPHLLFPLSLLSVLVIASHTSGHEAERAALRSNVSADQAVLATDEGPTVLLEGASAVSAERHGDTLEFLAALGPGVDLIREIRGGSALEDWIRFAKAPKKARVRYQVGLGALAGLRLVDRTLEGLDSEGTPRVRMHRPWIADAAGVRWPVSVAVVDCAVDLDPRPPWGRSITKPGSSTCTLELSWSLPESGYPALLDPEWARAGDLVIGRTLHSATRLSDGRVLLVGGYSDTLKADLGAAELFDPRTRTFAATGPLTTPRRAQVAALLDDGRVLVVGGDVGFGTPTVLSSVERYDVSSGRWTSLPDVAVPRSHHTVSILRDGRVLIVGSIDYANDGAGSPSVELCAKDGSACRVTTSLSVARASHTASLLRDGRVLVTGGGARIFDEQSSLHATSAIFEPASEGWTPGPPLPSARFDHVAVTLGDGTTLLVGGSLAPQGQRISSEVLSLGPTESAFTIAGALTIPRWLHGATLLPGDRLLVVGAAAPFYLASSVATTEVYDVGARMSSPLPDLEPMYWHTQTALADGRVLVAGGGAGATPKRAYVYSPPPAPTPTPTPSSTGTTPNELPDASTPRSDASTPSPSPASEPTGFYSCSTHRSGDPSPLHGLAFFVLAWVGGLARRLFRSERFTFRRVASSILWK